jgi:arsenate reductase
MAEGFARHLGGGGVSAASAGIEAHGLNPKAVDVMHEIGINIAQHKSEVVSDDMIAAADLIITVCDHAREHCPVIPSRVRQLHWSFDDPAKARGSEEEVLKTFRRVRDEIGSKVRTLMSEMSRTGAHSLGS